MDSDPSSWYSVIDPDTKKTYYVNANTGETQWEPPTPPAPPTFSTAATTSTTTTNRPVILLARDMLHRHAMADDKDSSSSPFDYIQNELTSLTAGQIADLVYETRAKTNHHHDSSDTHPYYYVAMDPYDNAQFSDDIHSTQQRPMAEISRIETRLHALRSEQQRLHEKR
jgi:hypothetical protein